MALLWENNGFRPQSVSGVKTCFRVNTQSVLGQLCCQTHPRVFPWDYPNAIFSEGLLQNVLA